MFRYTCHYGLLRSGRCLQRKILPTNHFISAIGNYVHTYVEKTTARHILTVYELKTRHSNWTFNSVQNIESMHHPVVLTAKPNEFEKLPPKCSSCGAILQSEHENHTGYVPQKKFFESIKEDTLNTLACLNCFQLKSYNKATVKRISNGEVINQLKHLRQQKALILYIVDMFDIEGTMLKNLLQVIGKKKRIILVGNKVDRLPQDDKRGSRQLEHMKDILKELCFKYSLDIGCNFRDICLVSGKSGFGVLSLIEKIQKHRDPDMDVYLIGCTNTGKSTLYNLIINLLNVHKEENLPAQGIVHHLPGTTNSLIRHDISIRRLERLKKRLMNEPWESAKEMSIDEDFYNFVREKDYYPLDKLYTPPNDRKFVEGERMSSVEPIKVELVNDDFLSKRKKEKKQNFLYDTPGVLNDSQIIRYLTSSEINYLSPQKWIVPRTYLLKPGGCLFIGGIARLDYLDIERPHRIEEIDEEKHDRINLSTESIYVTLMMSPNVPAHVTVHETADEKYEKLFLNGLLQIPEGNKERFDNYPPLKPVEYTVVGKNRNINCCDITLHGVGWLSVAAITAGKVKMLMHTPNGVGQSLRENPLLPYTVRKKDGRGVAYLGHINRNMYGSSRRKNPQFTRLFQHQNQPAYLWKAKIRDKMKVDRIQTKEDKRVQRLKEGILLGRMKKLAEKEKELGYLEDVNIKKKSLDSH